MSEELFHPIIQLNNNNCQICAVEYTIDNDSCFINMNAESTKHRFEMPYNHRFQIMPYIRSQDVRLEPIGYCTPCSATGAFDRYREVSQPIYQQNLRKCAYIIAAIETSIVLGQGAVEIKINDMLSVYILKRNYDGTPTGETCALICVPKRHVIDLFDSKNQIYTVLRAHPLIADIPGILSLLPYRLVHIKCMFRYFFNLRESELIIFNIEPKGMNNIHERFYPSANICLPGGGIEDQDDGLLEKCARREFMEETGFVLPDDQNIIAEQMLVFNDRHAMYYIMRLRELIRRSDS